MPGGDYPGIPVNAPQYDRDNFQSGMYATPDGNPANSTLNFGAANALKVFLMRFVPSRAMVIRSLAFDFSQAEVGANDAAEQGIYDAGGNLIGTTGSAVGMLTNAGFLARNLLAPTPLARRTVYYSAWISAYTGTTAPGTAAFTVGHPGAASLFSPDGSGNPAMPFAEIMTSAVQAAAALPASLTGIAMSNVAGGPCIALREF